MAVSAVVASRMRLIGGLGPGDGRVERARREESGRTPGHLATGMAPGLFEACELRS